MKTAHTTESSSAEEQPRQNVDQLTLLVRASESLTRSLSLTEILQASVEAAAKLSDLDSAAIYLLENDTLYLGATTPPLPALFPEALRTASLVDHPHIRQTIATNSVVFLPDAHTANLTEAERAACDMRGLRTIIFLPLASSKGVLGVLILGSVAEPRAISEGELGSCHALCRLAAVAVENAHLFQATQEELNDELHDAQDKLIRHEKLAVLGQLAGGVGHELRNPLAVISNAAYYLKLIQPEADTKVKEHLAMIERECGNATGIINDLLDFARIKSVEREPVLVRELVRNVLARFPAPEGVRVTLDLPADLPAIYADPRQVAQVLGNLVTNAYQAMPEGGELVIRAEARGQGSGDRDQGTEGSGQGDFVALSVRDTGGGIPPENMRKLFEPLFTTKAKGIGLGLAVSRKLVEANDGWIEVQSELGVGSVFTLYLPMYVGEVAS